MKTCSAFLMALVAMNLPVSGAWVNITGSLAGKSSACGNTNNLFAVPRQNKIIVGINGGQGLYATTDNGASWQALGSSTLWGDQSTTIFDKDYPDTFWQCGDHGGGIHKSTDGGKTFTVIPNATDGDGIGVDLTDRLRKTMLFGSHESANLRKTTDNGATWINITAGTTGWTNYPVVFNSSTYLVVSQNGGGISRTVDGGQTWTHVVNGISASWDPLLTASGTVYVGVNNGASGEPIMRSTDQGLTWTTLPKAAPTYGTWYSPIEMPDGSIVAIAGTSLVQCSDGKTWKSIGSPIPSTGLSQGNIAYNSVTGAFFMSFQDCGTVVQPKAYWRLDFVSSAAYGTAPRSVPGSAESQKFVVTSGQFQMARGITRPSASTFVDIFSARGILMGRARVGADGVTRVDGRKAGSQMVIARVVRE